MYSFNLNVNLFYILIYLFLYILCKKVQFLQTNLLKNNIFFKRLKNGRIYFNFCIFNHRLWNYMISENTGKTS